MRRVVRGLFLLVLIVTALPSGPAVAQEQAARSVGRDRLPDGAELVATPDGPVRRSLSDDFAAFRGYRDRGAWLRTMSDAIERVSGKQPAAIAAGQDLAASTTADDEEPEATGSLTLGMAAGDLDRDGRGDVAVLREDAADGAITMEARSGGDARLLWTRAGEGDGTLAWPLEEDVTGDGVPDFSAIDLTVLSEEESGDCEDCFEYRYSATFRWLVGVVSGADGATVWSRSYDGNVNESIEMTGTSNPATTEFSYDYHLDGVNLELIPFLHDGAGDGSADVVVEALDADIDDTYTGRYLWTPVADTGTSEATYQLNSTTRLDLFNGATGQGGQISSTPSVGALALVWPAGDLDGDTGDDLITERIVSPNGASTCVFGYVYTPVVEDGAAVCPDEVEQSTLQLTALDGATLAQLWTKAYGDYGFYWPLGGDVDADGAQDLSVLLEGAKNYATAFVSGADGRSLWSLEGDVIPFTVGPLDAVAGDDVTLLSFEYDWETDAVGDLTFSRRHGLTGAELFASRHAFEAPETSEGEFVDTWMYASARGDMDGDGSTDLTVGVVHDVVRESDEEEWRVVATEAAGVAESGSVPDRRLHAISEQAPTFLLAAPDLDGDGLSELALERYAGQAAQLEILRVRDLHTLWQESVTADYSFYEPIGDLDGDGGIDLMRHEWNASNENHVTSDLSALRGATGETLWGLSTR